MTAGSCAQCSLPIHPSFGIAKHYDCDPDYRIPRPKRHIDNAAGRVNSTSEAN